MTLGERYKQLKTDLLFTTAEILEYIKRDYAEASIEVLDAHPKLWEMVNSLE